MSPLNSFYPYSYQYSNLSYANNPYIPFQQSNWGEVNLTSQTAFSIPNLQQNMKFMQNARVISQETKGKNPPELIIIDSEE